MSEVKKPYTKPPLSIDAQIALLQGRGLDIKDRTEAEFYLRNVSYYHLSIYFKFFQRDDAFFEGTTFDDVLRIYQFDNKLRFLLLEIMERIEKSFKCRMAYELSTTTGNAHCHLDASLYQDATKHAAAIKILADEFFKSPEPSVLHYKELYSEPPLPPIWMAVEILSFGQCVKICKSLKREYKNRVTHTWNGDDERFVLNWMHCLSILRNHCAHHSRLWNRDFVITLTMKHKAYRRYFVEGNRRLFNHLVVLQILLKSINPTSSWLERLKELIEEYNIEVRYMGFPPDWEERLRSIMSHT